VQEIKWEARFLTLTHGKMRKREKSKHLDFTRHNYAVENINQWIGEGFEFYSKLVYLSKSMGHSSLESTKYYFSLVPAMADILLELTGCDFDNIVPEVEYEEG